MAASEDTGRRVGEILEALEEVIAARKGSDGTRSYTAKLLAGGVPVAGAKVTEEADELVRAAAEERDDRVVSEAADLVYHTLVLLACRDVPLRRVESELARRFGVSGLAESGTYHGWSNRMSDDCDTWLLRIGIPSKGRLAELAAQLLSDAGLSFRRTDRSLFARRKDMPVEITFLRTDDIPVLVAEGAIGLGVTGADLVAESGADVVHRLDLGVGSCRLALCLPDDSAIDAPAKLAGRRIATSFPCITRRWLAERGVHDAHFVALSGSVEVMITLGVADAIVDLVETGSTLAANRLRVLEELGRYETVLVQDPNLSHPELADRIVRRLEGIVIARGWSLLEYNVPRARLAEAERITPGFKSPTIMALEDSGWCAIRAMVKRGEAHAVIEKLEAIGASAIIETRIANCRL